ncbi:hypothetical protein [uncultured Pseudodesulfovibrio sp.]|uniref:hypothetical protein n=1 Tax=uncultured Pseudodesulfovibrio sp. TaxID=2035858 RepID=UPI0029C821E9|nr:hypothetical protein [uncultured Pseudodesulfovibrio sp.]
MREKQKKRRQDCKPDVLNTKSFLGLQPTLPYKNRHHILHAACVWQSLHLPPPLVRKKKRPFTLAEQIPISLPNFPKEKSPYFPKKQNKRLPAILKTPCFFFKFF